LVGGGVIGTVGVVICGEDSCSLSQERNVNMLTVNIKKTERQSKKIAMITSLSKFFLAFLEVGVLFTHSAPFSVFRY